MATKTKLKKFYVTYTVTQEVVVEVAAECEEDAKNMVLAGEEESIYETSELGSPSDREIQEVNEDE